MCMERLVLVWDNIAGWWECDIRFLVTISFFKRSWLLFRSTNGFSIICINLGKCFLTDRQASRGRCQEGKNERKRKWKRVHSSSRRLSLVWTQGHSNVSPFSRRRMRFSVGPLTCTKRSGTKS